MAQALLEPVALRAPGALAEVPLGLRDLVLREHTIEERLHQLLALLAPVDHVGTTVSARFFLRIRLPRCRRDITVPIGMSRICAASAYENSPISTSTSTSRKSCGTSARASTIESWLNRSRTRSSSAPSGVCASSLL